MQRLKKHRTTRTQHNRVKTVSETGNYYNFISTRRLISVGSQGAHVRLNAINIQMMSSQSVWGFKLVRPLGRLDGARPLI